MADSCLNFGHAAFLSPPLEGVVGATYTVQLWSYWKAHSGLVHNIFRYELRLRRHERIGLLLGSRRFYRADAV